jgi:hypothetical protein
MKLNIFVGFSLFAAAFIAGSIFLITFLKTSVFVYIYFTFSLLLLIAIGASLKKEFPEQIRLLFLIIPALLIVLSLTLFGSSVKNYYESNKEIYNLDASSQIENLSNTNEYYTSYVDFLNSEILKIRQESLDLQSQIDNFTAQKNLTNQIPGTIPNNPPIYIYEEESEEEDD